MSTYVTSGSNVHVINAADATVSDRLPPNIYVLKFSRMAGFSLELFKSFEIPTKFYGDVEKDCDNILDTYLSRKKNTGVLLSGNKGSGKSLLSKLICQKALELNIPTILINNNFEDGDITTFLKEIRCPCIMFFDEFEKNFDKEQQNHMLTLLDGVYTGNALFLFTCNERYAITEHMINRPGRVYYHMEYGGISDQLVKEYCEKELKNPKYLTKIIAMKQPFEDFNFDMLQCIVEEVNRKDVCPFEILPKLNIKHDITIASSYRAVVKDTNGNEVINSIVRTNPRHNEQRISDDKRVYYFVLSDVTDYDIESDVYTFVSSNHNNRGYTLVLSKAANTDLIKTSGDPYDYY